MQSTELTHNNFSYIQTFNNLLTYKNIKHACNITTSWLTAHLKTDRNSDILLATDVYHRIYKVLETSDRINFGELLLIPSRNIAEKSVLRQKQDKLAYTQLRTALFEAKEANHLESIIGYSRDCFTEDYLESLHPDSPKKSANTNGLCASISLYLIGQLLDLDEINESTLIEAIRKIQKGVSGEVAAKQELYQEFEFDIVGTRVFNLTDETSKMHFVHDTKDILLCHAERLKVVVTNDFSENLQKTLIDIIDTLLDNEHCELIQFKITQSEIFRELQKNQDLFFHFDMKALLKAENYRKNALAHLYGFKQDLEGTYLAQFHLGKESDFASSAEHLENYENLEHGIYQISFKTRDDRHSIVYIKTQDGTGYFFDPSKGLIKCGVHKHLNVLLKLLSSYPPPSERLPQENNDRNYRVNLTQYTRMRNF